MRLTTLSLVLLAAVTMFGQSHRVPPSGPVNASQPSVQTGDPAIGVKQMYDEVNGYVRAKVAEFETKKTPFSDSLLTRTELEQRQLAAKYAAISGARSDLAGDDF